MFRFPLTKHPQISKQPFSMQSLGKASRLRGATVTEGVCPYCAVGYGQLIYSKGSEIINIEGRIEHGRGPTCRLPLAHEGQGEGRDPDPRRSAFHAHVGRV
jgi:hypothetical protein